MVENYKIDIITIQKYQAELINLSKLTESNIQDIFIKESEVRLDDFSNLEYSGHIPLYLVPEGQVKSFCKAETLYQKMIFRFRNSDNSPCTFYKGCDYSNQKLLLSHAGLNSYDVNTKKIMEFFAAIRNMFSIVDIIELNDDTAKIFSERGEEYLEDFSNNNSLYLQWKKENEIKFFFGLDSDQQQKVIDKYNSMIGCH